MPSSSTRLPTTKPQRVRRFLDFLLSFLSFGFLGKEGKESTLGTRLTMSLIDTTGLKILRIGTKKNLQNKRKAVPSA